MVQTQKCILIKYIYFLNNENCEIIAEETIIVNTVVINILEIMVLSVTSYIEAHITYLYCAKWRYRDKI